MKTSTINSNNRTNNHQMQNSSPRLQKQSQSPYSNQSKSRSPTQTYKLKNKFQELNAWEYCNPENNLDQLPQPYRFINKCLSDMILQPVYSKVFEIQQFKNDPNYDGMVKEVPPQGSFEIDGISALYQDNNNPQNSVIAGDQLGNLILLDLNQKTQIMKYPATPAKRVIFLTSQTVQFLDSFLTTIASISRASGSVLIFRMYTQDPQIFHNFSINVCADSCDKANDFPMSCSISPDACFISIVTYNGDVRVYRIPDPPLPIEEKDQIIEQKPNLGTNPLPSPKDSLSPDSFNTNKDSPQKRSIQYSLYPALDFKPEEIKDVWLKLDFKGIKKEVKYDDVIAKMKEDIQQLKDPNFGDTVVDPKGAVAAPGKDSKKADKKGGKPADAPPPQEEQQNDDIQKNKIIVLPSYNQANNGGDISEDLLRPQFEAKVFFLKEAINIVNEKRLFNSIKSLQITTGVVITWTGAKTFEHYVLQACNKENLPNYVQYQINQLNQANNPPAAPTPAINTPQSGAVVAPPQKPIEQPKKQQNPIEFVKQVNEYSLIYPITAAQISEDRDLIAFGLQDGTIIIWDMLLVTEKCFLDKHQDEITCLSFLDSWQLISGAQDGSVHLYNLEKQKLEMKRTNIFMEKREYSISNISVSQSGLAFVLDSLGNLRLYDMWRGEQIAKLVPVGPIDTRLLGYMVDPLSVMHAQKDQFCIVTRVMGNKNQVPVEGEAKIETVNVGWTQQSNVQIFRVFDNLLNLYPGLSNVSRRGVEREKIINLYSRITLQQLQDPTFEIPMIGLATSQNSLKKVGSNVGSSSKRMSVSSKSKNQMMNTQDQKMETMQKDPSFQPPQQNQTVRFHASSLQKGDNQSQLSADSQPDLNSSFKTHLSHTSSLNRGSQSKMVNTNNKGLTKELLHPEQVFFQRMAIPSRNLVDTTQDAIENTRKLNANKVVRANDTEKANEQISSYLAQKQELRIAEKKQEYLKNSSQL